MRATKPVHKFPRKLSNSSPGNSAVPNEFEETWWRFGNQIGKEYGIVNKLLRKIMSLLTRIHWRARLHVRKPHLPNHLKNLSKTFLDTLCNMVIDFQRPCR